MAEPESTVRGRLGRYVRVGRTVGGTAARLVGNRYLGLNLDRGKHAADLKLALGTLKGPLMKAAQILATIPDALPAEYAAELSELQANAPSMGWPFVKRRMAAELGPDWQSKFKNFERTAARAASLGQVHRAESHDGQQLACKLQYPDMGSAVAADLRQLKLLFSIHERRDKAISTSQIHAELSDRLREELDYEREARHTRMFREMLADEATVHVPAVINEFSAKRLLTTTWYDGQTTYRVRGAARRRPRRRCLQHIPGLVRALLLLRRNSRRSAPWATTRFAHRMARSTCSTSAAFAYSIRSSSAASSISTTACVPATRHWRFTPMRPGGFKNISRETVRILNIWANFVYAPIMEDRVQRIQESESGLYGANIAHKVHHELRQSGGVTPPREFVLMDRAAIGLGSVFLRLRAEINWHRLFHDLIDGFDLEALTKRQNDMLVRHDLPLP